MRTALSNTYPTALSGVKLRVLLHDALIDLDKAVKVICNGQTVFEGRVERSAEVMLDTLAGYGDPTMTASSSIQIDLD